MRGEEEHWEREGEKGGKEREEGTGYPSKEGV